MRSFTAVSNEQSDDALGEAKGKKIAPCIATFYQQDPPLNNILDQLRCKMKTIFPQGAIETILFGSYARGDAEADSDIDVMVLVDAPRQEISAKIWEIGSVAADLLLESGLLVSPIVENRDYFLRNASFFPLYKNIMREGVNYRD